MSTYDSLSIDGKIRVNAAIIEGFKTASSDDLNAFRRAAYAHNPSNPAEGFQGVLDAMRNTLATSVDTLPKTRDNGIDEKIDLSNQRQLLRNIKETMGQELSYVENGDLSTGRYYSPEHYAALVGQREVPQQDGANPITLGGLVTETTMRSLIEGQGINLGGAKACHATSDDVAVQPSQGVKNKPDVCSMPL